MGKAKTHNAKVLAGQGGTTTFDDLGRESDIGRREVDVFSRTFTHLIRAGCSSDLPQTLARTLRLSNARFGLDPVVQPQFSQRLLLFTKCRHIEPSLCKGKIIPGLAMAASLSRPMSRRGWSCHVLFLHLSICLADVPSRSSCFSSRSACGRRMMG